MNVSDYIVDFLHEKGIKHVYGYQGTMICYFLDAVYRSGKIHNHSCYNEQGAAFAACGAAQSNGKCAVAYSTSGPGAVNLLSGVANAYMDSLPTVFITGQVNSYEYSDIKQLRQQSFQEIDIVNMAKPVTKYTTQITDASKIRYELEKAWAIANSGRKGPVLLDIPMNIQRTDITDVVLEDYEEKDDTLKDATDAIEALKTMLSQSERPVLMVGNGVSHEDRKKIIDFATKGSIPIVTSLLARGMMPNDHPLNFGYTGTYGTREANLVCSGKADLIIAVGISLCTRQTGMKLDKFAAGAKLLRIDCDKYILQRKVKPDEVSFELDANAFIDELENVEVKDYSSWLKVCQECRKILNEFDDTLEERKPNEYISAVSALSEEGCPVVSDVGQHMMWMAQSFKLKKDQEILFSGGHGAMGYALPAAIGAHYATGKKVYAFAGDGSMQMNIQELQWVSRERLPVKMFVMNNEILGMIHFQQKEYFDSRFAGCAEGFDYLSCNFKNIADAYNIPSVRISSVEEIAGLKELMDNDEPLLVELMIGGNTAAYPKTYLGEEIYNQKPYIQKEKLDYMLEL